MVPKLLSLLCALIAINVCYSFLYINPLSQYNSNLLSLQKKNKIFSNKFLRLYDTNEPYSVSSTTKSFVRQSDCIIVIAADSLSISDLKSIRKQLPIAYKTTVETRKKLLEAVDGTPFSLLTEDSIYNSNFCIYIKDEPSIAREFMTKLAKQIAKNQMRKTQAMQYLFCSRVYCMKITIL